MAKERTVSRPGGQAEKEVVGKMGESFPGFDAGADDVSQAVAIHQGELETKNEELRQNQSDMEESQLKYFELYEFAPIGYFMFDPKGIILEVNLAGAALLGLPRHLLRKTPFVRFVAPECLREFFSHFKRVFTFRTSQSCELKLTKKKGVSLYVSMESNAIRDSGGQDEQCRSAIIDISARIRAEEELRKNRRNLEKRIERRTAAWREANEKLKQHIEEGKKVEEALRKSEEEGHRLAKENAAIARIGKIISSTLNIDEIFERFSAQVRKLILFERLVIDLHNPQTKTGTVAYISGLDLPERRKGEVFPLQGSITELVSRRRRVFLVPLDNEEEANKFPPLLPHFRHGFKSILVAPLINRGEVIGALQFQSILPNAYSASDFKLAEGIASQIAGAIASARLFGEHEKTAEALRRSEESSRRLAQESAIIAEIGKIIGSTLNIEGVYEKFAEEVGKLLPSDRVVINLASPEGRNMIVAYASGLAIDKRRVGDTFLTQGSISGEIINTRMPLLLQPMTQKEGQKLKDRFEGLIVFEAGIKSVLGVPLVSGNTAFGVLFLQSKIPQAYSGQDLQLAERISMQIAEAIANAQLFQARKTAEESLKISLTEKEVLLKEIHHRVKNNMQIISSLLNLQSQSIQDDITRRAFQESQDRIGIMALIHEKLYRSEHLSRIDLAAYVQQLAQNLYQAYGVSPETIALHIEGEGVFLDIDYAIPCGLILNELLSNSLKYAFPGGRRGRIEITLHEKDERVNLLIRDDGAGFPEGLDFRKNQSLGLQLVNALTRQLDGTIELNRKGGTEFKITFPQANRKNRRREGK